MTIATITMVTIVKVKADAENEVHRAMRLRTNILMTFSGWLCWEVWARPVLYGGCSFWTLFDEVDESLALRDSMTSMIVHEHHLLYLPASGNLMISEFSI